MAKRQKSPTHIPPVKSPRQFDGPQLGFDLEVDQFLWVNQARQAFRVSGQGLTVAVLDTGLNSHHVDFAGRVLTQVNFTDDNGGNYADATDGDGHGTNVAGLIVGNGDHVGIAPAANVIPLKVLPNEGDGSFQAVSRALQWVIEQRAAYTISAVCMSLGDRQNYTQDNFGNDAIRNQLRTLRAAHVPVVIAAGNDYFTHQSAQGMAYPAILRECISVGAVYDTDIGEFDYGGGLLARRTRAGQITPFSQRLHESVNRQSYTRIFAPGSFATAAGINGAHGESIQQGTSQATPVTVGIILLVQEFYLRAMGTLPPVDLLLTCLRRGGVTIQDGDDEDDTVGHTNLDFIRVDALSALDAVRRELQKLQLIMPTP
ncbi:MAG: S8 family serine peptidase [Caldilineaceae bacterium]|nr:S8 family serine peptidase [Caldilineaceae bacterium]